MKSYQLFNWKTKPRLVDVPQPTAGPNQVLVKVGGNGLCHSDLHAVDDLCCSPLHLDIELPMTLGHEVAGWVEAPGPGVRGLEIGLPCAITAVGCGQCVLCAQGWNNYCRSRAKQVGMGLDGGLSEYVVAPVGAIVPLHSLAPWQAAPLTDAGLSSYHAVKRVLPLLTPGSSVLVIGVGGLGHLAIAALKAMCAARVIAVDQRPQALELGISMGADLGMLTNDTTAQQILDATAGAGVQAVLDFVGVNSSIQLARQVIRPLGHIVVVGRGGGSIDFTPRGLPYGACISSSFGGSKLELMELLALAEAGRIACRIERHPLSQVDTVFDKLRRNEIIGRAVIVPDGH
ncbi:alcohol dehydrogenase catalytic domain-containing protein [Paraburkholderia sediminicola]|uniref:alcohol dehydrogenase catalytic domain-containing protein n=1 Tax=Paraburkholderia sediminicola TaxID=458836 RepID=UPI0038BA5A14